MNRAEDLGAVEAGKDVSGINVSGLPVSGPEVEVRPSSDGTDLILKQIHGHRQSRKALELVHSETDLLAAQLTEDPEMTTFQVPNVGAIEASASRLQKALTRNSNREALVWFGVDSAHLSAALGDRLIVRRDTLESEYVCKECKGKGHTDEVCALCDGKQQKEGQLCKNCLVLGFEAEKPHPAGFTKCVACSGAGWRNGIIIPEVAQGKPVTGVVVSIGPDTKLLKLGDRVLHSKYAGHTLEMKNETYTYMREHEVISLLRDL